uniref:Uncharacterized protein n=1 Tax=Tanacetum cinerariifolium TaxID=118510 RepID=A0A6L2LYB6_TANCI|nr:hypothetical protein [Tanacetum cinerariifolium]
MRTRNSYYLNNSSVTISRRQNKRRTPNVVEPELRTIVEVAPMADNRTMEELLQAPTEGYGETIVILEINADHFEIKTNLLQLVQANPYHGFERDNPHTHINNFKRVTLTLKFRDVPNDVIKLMMFPYSLEGSARVCNHPSVYVVTGTYNQVAPQNRASNYMAPPGFASMQNSKNSDAPQKAFRKAQRSRQISYSMLFLGNGYRSITHPKGVAEDIFVKVGKFHFLTDFVVVDFEADPRVPLILGRSFWRTGRALIDVFGEEITLRVKEEAVTFNLNQTTRYSSTYDDLSQGEVAKAKSSIEEPLELELKDLPSHLEYAYLEGVDNLPVIIVKDLKDNEKEALLKVLKSHKRAIGKSPTSRVNPKIHEVIKKEVIKLLDVGMIYPISDSPWVSPIHCVPQKGGTTIVENENNELIPTRLEVDRAKVDVIAKLPHSMTVKGVRSFLGYAGFYRRFIQDFSKIARPMTHLEKETSFVFSKDCIDAFETLKKKLTEAPILVVPDWNLPFKLMYFANFHSGSFIIKGMSSHKRRNSLKTLNITSGTIPTFFGYVQIKSFDGVCMTKKLMISSKLVMKDLPGAIMVPISPARKYILVAVDYLSKWVEAKALPTIDARVVVKFIKSLFARFKSLTPDMSERWQHTVVPECPQFWSLTMLNKQKNTSVAPPSIDIVKKWFATIGYGEEVFAKWTLKKSLLPPSKEATKGGSSKVPTSSKTGNLKRKKESSLAIDSNPSQTSASTPIVVEMHKEDQQATGNPKYLRVTRKEKSNPQLISDSTTKADPGISALMTLYLNNRSQKHKLELEKNNVEAEVALLKAQPSFSNMGQLNELLANLALTLSRGRKTLKTLNRAKEVNQRKQQSTPPHITQITPTIITTTTTHVQSPCFSSPPKSFFKHEREQTKEDKGKKTMSSKDDEEESTESDSDDDTIHLAASVVGSSRIKKVKKFDFVTEGGKHIHLTKEEINQQKKIEEDVKAEAAKRKSEVRKEELVDLLGLKVVEKYYNAKLQKGPITLKVYREDDTSTGVSTDSDDTMSDVTPVGVTSVVQEGVTPSKVDMTVDVGKHNSSDDTIVPESFPPLSTPVNTAGNALGKFLYANITSKPSGIKVKVRTLFTPEGNEIDVNNPLILKKWHPDENLLKEDVSIVPVWVKLYDVHVTAFNEDGLSAIATKLVDNDVEFGTNRVTSNLGNNEATPSGKLRLDNDGNPQVPTGIVESDSEMDVVYDETANLMIPTNGNDRSPGLDDHSRTFSSLLLAEIDKTKLGSTQADEDH